MGEFTIYTPMGGYCPVCLHDKRECVCAVWFSETKKEDTMSDRLKNVNLIDELDFTFIDVETQLIEDQKRWGDTWKDRGLVYKGQSQEERFFQKITEYIEDYRENGTSLPWNKIIGEAHIALVREKKLSR